MISLSAFHFIMISTILNHGGVLRYGDLIFLISFHLLHSDFSFVLVCASIRGISISLKQIWMPRASMGGRPLNPWAFP